MDQYLPTLTLEINLFSAPKNTTIANGQKAVVFDSGSHLISLKEMPEIDLQLLAENSDTVLISKMPAATSQSIRAEKDSEGQVQWFAGIYVYL